MAVRNDNAQLIELTMTTSSLPLLYLALLALNLSTCIAFLPQAPQQQPNSKRIHAGADNDEVKKLFMVPRYNKETKRWSPTSPEEEASAGYSPFGSLLRQGPVPFIQRLRDPDGYDQGVLKMLANENFASRDEAQGNMDAYLQNPNDYALQKLEEKRTGVKYDYANANMSGGDLALTAAWTGVLLSVLARVLYVSQNGCDTFCQTYHW